MQDMGHGEADQGAINIICAASVTETAAKSTLHFIELMFIISQQYCVKFPCGSDDNLRYSLRILI